MAGTPAAELGVVLTGDSSGLEAAIKRGDAALDGFGRRADQGAANLHSRVSASWDRLGRQTAIAGAAMTAGITVPLERLAKRAVDETAKIETAVAGIGTIRPDIDPKYLFKTLNEMQRRVPETAQKLGEGLYNIFSTVDNISAEGAAKLTETFAKGAVGAQTTAERFGTSILGVMNAYKSGLGSANHISDLYFNTVNRGVVTGAQLAPPPRQGHEGREGGGHQHGGDVRRDQRGD